MKSQLFNPVRLQSTIAANGNADRSDDRISLALEEYASSIDAGEPLSRQALLEKYGDVAEELVGCLDSLDFIRQVAPQFSDAPMGNGNAVGAQFRPDANLGDFRIVREIGRGGMGVVYEAQQLSLGRRVALKVLPFAAMLDRQQLARFKNEARAAATLDHPNIVAVHSVGVDRGVHYYAMQLVDGQSLAQVVEQLRAGSKEHGAQSKDSELLAPSRVPPGRLLAPESEIRSPKSEIETEHAALSTLHAPASSLHAPSSSLPAFASREYFRTVAKLGMQAAEALDHAHQNGILHRDIKPANLLVDDTGKLWITDFGLARLEADAGMTMTGDLLGTLRYMSPEQALAKRVVVDHRSDVYSLGVTLYELLTLQPAFTGDDRQELLRQIAFEEPCKPRQINPRIPHDLETILLKAIEKNPADRFVTAKELAADLQWFLDDEPIKAKPQTALRTVRKWSHRHRGLLIVIAISLVISVVAVAGSIGWTVRDRAARQMTTEATANQALDEATRLIERSKWPEALAAVNRAEDVLSVSGHVGASSARAQDLRKDVEMVLRLEEIRFSPESASSDDRSFSSPTGDVEVDDPQTGPKYAQAFKDFGIDIAAISPREAAARISARAIRLELIMTLDTWARWTRFKNSPDSKRLTEVARAADPDPLRNTLRDLLELAKEERKPALISLAQSVDTEDMDPRTAWSLAAMLDNVDAWREAMEPLQSAHQSHPDDYYINYRLAQCSEWVTPSNVDDAIRFYTAAIALRPDCALSHNNLGRRLSEKGLAKEAIAHYKEAVRLQPGFVIAHSNLGRALSKAGLFDEAVAHCREAVRLQPQDSFAHSALAYALGMKGALDEAITECHVAIRLKSDNVSAHNQLGIALSRKGLLDEAVASFKEMIRLEPDNVEGHINLGIALEQKGLLDDAILSYQEALRLNPNSPSAHKAIGDAYSAKGLLDEAIASYREAIHLQPDFADAYINLGSAQIDKGLVDDALASWKEALRLHRDNATVHLNLGCAFFKKRDYDQAIKYCREATCLNPNSALAHSNLGGALFQKGLLEDVLASYREALRLKPDFPAAQMNIGEALLKKGEFDEGLANYTRAIQAQLKHGDKNQATQTYQTALDLLEKNKAPADGVRRFRAELEPLLNLTQMSRDHQEALSSQAPPPEAEAAGSH